MLEYIKSDKHMKMSHWRYQLLHWVFSIPEEDRTVEKSPLPRYLYTHYCPIFHLTNLLLLTSPFIVLYRLSKAFVLFFTPLWSGFKFVMSQIESFILECGKRRSQIKREKIKEYQQTKEYAINDLKKDLKNGQRYAYRAYANLNLTEEEYDQIIAEFSKRQQQLKEKAREKERVQTELLKEKREAWQKRITFWVNFSRPLIKGLLNVLYACIFLLSAYVLFLVTPFIVNGILWCVYQLFSISFYHVFLWIWMGVKLLLIATAMILTAVTLWRYAPQKQIKNTLGIPCNIFLNALNSFGEWAEEKCNDTIEFIKMFYEENCPPVIIDEE